MKLENLGGFPVDTIPCVPPLWEAASLKQPGRLHDGQLDAARVPPLWEAASLKRADPQRRHSAAVVVFRLFGRRPH